MASGFTFGFQSEDIDEDVSDNEVHHGSGQDVTKPETQGQSSESKTTFEAKSHGLDELLESLPSQIFYNILRFRLFTEQESYLSIPRRDVSDAQTQLMAEATDVEENDDTDLATELRDSDVKQGLYEGGGKTWESSVDLAAVLAADYSFLLSEDVEEIRVIELGSGPAIPALALLLRIFQTPKPADPPKRKIHFVLSDFNLIFIRLFTITNVLLTWYLSRNIHPESEDVFDLDIDSELLDDFRNDLAAYGLSFTFISGKWSPEWVDLAFPPAKKEEEEGQRPSAPVQRQGYTLVFSSETIYSTKTAPQFVDTLVALLDRAAERHHHEPSSSSSSSFAPYRNPKALIAAKKLYFGVGGGVDFFLTILKDKAGERINVAEKVDVADQGVGRVVWEIELTGRKT